MSSTATKTVLPVTGSLRTESYNRKLIAAAASAAPSHLSLQSEFPIGRLPLFNEDVERDAYPEIVSEFCRRIETADGLLIATPEYSGGIPGVLKNAIDWVSRPATYRALLGKPVCIIGGTPGPGGTRLAQASLRQILSGLGALIVPARGVFVSNVHEQIDGAGEITQPAVRSELANTMTAFDSWIDATRAVTDWMQKA